MTGLRVWWAARRVARRELDALLAAVDVELGSVLDSADRGCAVSEPATVTTYINWRCHLCPEKFNNVFDMRDHWQRDHNYNVTIKIR
jgi:hypothetical protein